MTPRVVLLRGLSAAPWDLRPHELLADRYDVSVVVPRGNLYSTDSLRLRRVPARTLSDVMPTAGLARLAARAGGERFFGLPDLLRDADIVHAAELGNWYSAHAA